MSALASHLNWYDLMRDNKFDPNATLMSNSPERYGKTVINGVEKTYKRGFTFSEMFSWHKNHPGVKMAKNGHPEAVLAANLTDYMNMAGLRTALNILTD